MSRATTGYHARLDSQTLRISACSGEMPTTVLRLLVSSVRFRRATMRALTQLRHRAKLGSATCNDRLITPPRTATLRSLARH